MAKQSEAARIAELEAQLEAERAKNQRAIRLDVSAKGGVSLYGIRRFPVTFYQDEWATILDQGDNIRAFIKENSKQLKKKGD